MCQCHRYVYSPSQVFGAFYFTFLTNWALVLETLTTVLLFISTIWAPCCQMVTRVRRHLFSCAIVWHFGTWFSQFRWILPMDMILSHMHPLAHGIGWFDIKWFACHVNTTVGWKHCTFLSFGKLSVLFLELKVWKGLNVWVMKQPISRLWGDCGTTKAPFAQDCCDLVPWHLRAEQFALSLLSSHNKLSCIITHDTHDS